MLSLDLVQDRFATESCTLLCYTFCLLHRNFGFWRHMIMSSNQHFQPVEWNFEERKIGEGGVGFFFITDYRSNIFKKIRRRPSRLSLSQQPLKHHHTALPLVNPGRIKIGSPCDEIS